MGRNTFGGPPGPWAARAPLEGGWGVNAVQQYFAAGLVDEMEINLVPTLLGSGERLFDGGGEICTDSNSCGPSRRRMSRT